MNQRYPKYVRVICRRRGHASGRAHRNDLNPSHASPEMVSLEAYTSSRYQMVSRLQNDCGLLPWTRSWKRQNPHDWQQYMQSSSETIPLTATHSSSFLEGSKPVRLEFILQTWQKSLPLPSTSVNKLKNTFNNTLLLEVAISGKRWPAYFSLS